MVCLRYVTVNTVHRGDNKDDDDNNNDSDNTYFALVFVFIKNVNKWCNHEIFTANEWVTESVQCSEWC
jgi:hypothetical protein